MSTNQFLLNKRNQKKIRNLLVISILILSFSTTFLIRILPADYGWELNEFDPFFNFRATEYIVNNGIPAYFEWNDELSWYPHGRDVSINSQVALHLTTAITYQIFGTFWELYDYAIIFPVILGSLTTIVLFFFVRQIFGTTTALFSSLLFSISFPIILRGQIGWFKSEPLGLLFGIFSLYLLFSGLNSKNKFSSLSRILLGGFFLSSSISSWGGNQFFLIPLGLVIITIPIFTNEKKSLVYKFSIFVSSIACSALLFERLSTTFVLNTLTPTLVLPLIIVTVGLLIQHKTNIKDHKRNYLILIVVIIVIGSLFILVSENLFSNYSFRYLNSINPFLTTSNPLVDSISEHQTVIINTSFLFHSTLLIFSGIGIWLIFKNLQVSDDKKKFSLIFALIVGFMGVYVGSTFVRLEVFTSISLILLSSFALSEFFRNNPKINKKKIFSIIISTGLILILIIPLVHPFNSSIFTLTDNPPVILNGGTSYQISQQDWITSLDWLKNNTPTNSVIGSWWDYGYWIQTKSDRTSIADNSTLYDLRIKNIAKIFFSEPSEAWKQLNQMEVDYFIIFISGERLSVDDSNGKPLYVLRGGGDESKKVWFAKIAGVSVENYFESDLNSGTTKFWEETLLGKMIPFNVRGFYNPETNQSSEMYIPGWIPIYEKEIKYFDETQPLKLVYSSPSFETEKNGILTAVLIYEVNSDYITTD